jgi:cysteine sulfinate desulfinase/cysteine desulfurase-like protein
MPFPRTACSSAASSTTDPRAEKYGNASSLHSFGREAYDAMEVGREQTAKAIGATPRDIIFTSGGTESDNLAIQGAAYASLSKGKHIITSAVEHHAIQHSCQYLETQGFKVTYLPVDSEGVVSVESLKSARPRKRPSFPSWPPTTRSGPSSRLESWPMLPRRAARSSTPMPSKP